MPNAQKKIVLPLLVIFFVFCGLSYLFPYTSDDWAWGSSIGMERLRIMFKDYNGRYFGNFLVLIITRSKLLNILTKAASCTYICWLCYSYCGKKSTLTLLLPFALLLIMPQPILKEAIVWTSGFSNYVPPALISATYLYTISRITDKGPQKESHPILTFLMAFSGALFIENITVFNVVLGVAVVGLIWIKQHRFYRSHIGFLVGAVLGAAVIFSNSAYAKIVDGTGYYRDIPRSVMDTLYWMYCNAVEILDYLVFDNAWFCLIITSILVLLAIHRMNGESNETKKSRLLYASAATAAITCAIFFEYLVYRLLLPIPFDFLMLPATILYRMRIFIAFAYALSIVILMVLCVPRDWLVRTLLPYFSVVISMAPLLLVRPIGPRCVFIGYFLLMMCTCALFVILWTEVLNTKLSQYSVRVATVAVILVQLVQYGLVFVPIHYWDSQRNAFAKFQSDAGNDIIYLCTLPTEEYLHNSSPNVGNLIERYILFTGLRDGVTLEFVSTQELAQMIAEQMP